MTFLEYAKIVSPECNAGRHYTASGCPIKYGLPNCAACLDSLMSCVKCYAREVPHDLVCLMIESEEYDVPDDIVDTYGYSETWAATDNDEVLRLIGGTYGQRQ